MQWDFRDQLRMTRRQAVSPDDADGTAHAGEQTWYVYDAGGKRVRKVTDFNGVILKERIYVGPFEMYRNNGPNALVRETLHIADGEHRFALVETRTDTPAPQQLIRYQFGNHLGSASLELDGLAGIISYEEYTPYGSTALQAVRGQVTGAKRYRYTGMERDEETGLGYHSTRYYVPWLGRWTSPDMKGIEDTINLYQYVSGNPVRLVDLQGASGWERFVGGLKAVGGAFETAAGVGLVAAGIATSEIGIGIPIAAAGALVTAHGADTVVSGVRTAVAGEAKDTFTSQALQARGLTRTQANLTDAGIGIVGSLGASAATRAPAAVAALSDAAPVVARTAPVVAEAAPAVARVAPAVAESAPAVAESAPAAAQGLVHLTTEESAALIRASDTLGKGGTIYAGPASLADASPAIITLKTGLQASKATAAIAVPEAASGAFRVPAVVGPLTAWQRVSGTVYSAGAGSINLTTGAFTRVGPATNQLFVYGIDITTTAAMRSSPDIVKSLITPTNSEASSSPPDTSSSGSSAFATSSDPFAHAQAEIAAQQSLPREFQ
jgi:RHS repeat-associated protein